jgi:hypothetical protein
VVAGSDLARLDAWQDGDGEGGGSGAPGR